MGPKDKAAARCNDDKNDLGEYCAAENGSLDHERGITAVGIGRVDAGATASATS